MRVWPADYDSDCYVLLPIPVATIPIIGGLLSELEKQEAWASESDWEQGYQFAVCLQRCLVECGQSFSEVMTLLAVSLGANEIDEADLSPAFPALAARLAAARAADSANVLAKRELKASPSDIIRISELLKPFVEAGDDSSGEINIWRMLRSTWNFGAFWSTDMQQTQGVEKSVQEVGALLAVMAGLQERPISDVKELWPYIGPELEAAQGRDVALNPINQILPKETGNNKFSRVVRFTELTRVLQGEFPSTWWTWLGLGDVDYPQLWDLYRLQAAGSEIKVTVDGNEKTLWDYLTDAVGIGADAIDIVTDIAESAVDAGTEVAGATIQGAGLVMQAGLIGAIVGLSGQLATMQQNQVNANTNRVNEHLRTMNVLGGQAAMDDPQSLSGSSIFGNLNNLLQGSQLSDGRVNLWSLLQNQNTLESKFDALLQGGDLGDGRVNLYTLNQGISGLLLEMQTGQLYQLLVKLTDAAESDENFVSLFDLGELLQSIANNMALVEGNSSETADHTGILPILADQAHRIGYTNLYDLLQQLICICKATNTWLPVIAQKIGEIEPVLNIDGGYAPPAATLTAPPANVCQRVRWMVGRVRTALIDIMSHDLTVSTHTVDSVYFAVFDVDIPKSLSARLARLIQSYVYAGPNYNYLSMSDYITSIEDELICALYNATDSANAKLKWDQLMDSKGAGALAAPEIVKHAIWNGLLTEMYEGNIPRNAADLEDFSSDCSGCAGGGSVTGNTYNFSMELNTTPGEWNRYPFEVPNDPDPAEEWYFLIWELDVTRLKQFTESAADWSGVTTYKTNSADTIGSMENTFNLRPFISNGAGMSGWQIKTNFDQSQQPAAGYNVYFSSDPQSVADLQAGTLLTTSWQPLPTTGRICVYAKGVVGLATNAWSWMLIQLQAP